MRTIRGFIPLLLIVSPANCGVVISGLLIIDDVPTFTAYEDFKKTVVENGTGAEHAVTADADRNRIQRLAVGRHQFQIGIALFIVWIVVGFKIIFCCTIVLRHESKPIPFVRDNLRTQVPVPSSANRFRRDDGGALVHLPEEEEEEAVDLVKDERSSVNEDVGTESATPPPPYSSLGISL